MIDTHDAHDVLRLFRMRFVDDEDAFHAVAHLRRSILASEAEISDSLGISSQASKSLLQRLYQAGMVSVRHDRQFRLTSKGEFLSDRLGISSTASYSILESLDLDPLDIAFLRSHLALEEDMEGAEIGNVLLRYQALAVNAAWSSRVVRRNVVRRAAQVLAVSFVSSASIGRKEMVDALLAHSDGRMTRLEMKRAKHFHTRLRSVQADAALCDNFVLRAELPSSHEARAVVLLATTSRMLAALLRQSSHPPQRDPALQWTIRRNPELGQRICAEVVAWDRSLVEADLDLSVPRESGSLDKKERTDSQVAHLLFAALAGAFMGSLVSLALVPLLSSPRHRQLANEGKGNESQKLRELRRGKNNDGKRHE
ncbi:hypothetical protein [Nannocystis pusilla]|uniref:hypothetical protein n=1 Tax=Nannocystis pusilla TaxID=889268 RepID=UPI003DA3CD81